MKRLLLAAALALAGAAQASDFAEASGVDIAIRPGLVYQRAGGEDLKLDLYLPRSASAAKPVPLVVYIHGGGWVSGQREIANLRLMPFLEMGYAAANIGYRLASAAPAPAAVEDVRCALHYLAGRAKELGLDAQRILVAGSSAGGHLALMAGLLPEGSRFDRACAVPEASRWSGGPSPGFAAYKVAAVINWFGISDVNDLLQGANTRPFAVEWFGAMAEREALAHELSPLTHVRAGIPPVISFHGDADAVVPLAQSQRLHAALDKAGVPNRLLVMRGAGHGLPRTQMIESTRAAKDFLREQKALP